MISVLVCSANNKLLEQINENINKTIGVITEIVYYDNRKSNKGICEVYNELALKAQFPFLCFVHEDVLFVTEDWGKKITDIFIKNRQIGVIGIAGSKYKSSSYSGWFTGIKEFDCANYIHQYTHGQEKVYLKPQNHCLLEEVVCLDGVFICCRKEIWQSVKFDEKNLKGFHFYDISFTLQASKICSVAVTYEIDIVHITKGGNFGNNWVLTAIQYHLISKNNLPAARLPAVASNVEKQIVITWLDILKSQNISINNKFKWIRNQRLHAKITLAYHVIKFILYTPLKLKYLHNLFKRKYFLNDTTKLKKP